MKKVYGVKAMQVGDRAWIFVNFRLYSTRRKAVRVLDVMVEKARGHYLGWSYEVVEFVVE